MDRLGELRAMLTEYEADFDKFYAKNNKSAGVRVRKGMNELKKKAQEIRLEVQNMKTSEKAEG